MKHRLTIPVVIATLAMGGLTACGGNPEPEGPTPEEQARQDSIEAARRAQARADSIAEARRAEEARRQAELERQREIERETAAARDILQQRIHFPFDQATITSEAEQVLMEKVAVLRANPNVRIRVAGHADERGSIEYNLALSQRRAEAAKDFLAGYGIPSGRIETVGFGEDRPLVNASNERAWAQNRRDEFTIIAGGNQMRNPGE